MTATDLAEECARRRAALEDRCDNATAAATTAPPMPSHRTPKGGVPRMNQAMALLPFRRPGPHVTLAGDIGPVEAAHSPRQSPTRMGTFCVRPLWRRPSLRIICSPRRTKLASRVSQSTRPVLAVSRELLRWVGRAALRGPLAAPLRSRGLEPTVGLLADLAGDGRALELGVGTGRLALPLSRRGIRVNGIELSSAMVEQLRSQPGSPTSM